MTLTTRGGRRRDWVVRPQTCGRHQRLRESTAKRVQRRVAVELTCTSVSAPTCRESLKLSRAPENLSKPLSQSLTRQDRMEMAIISACAANAATLCCRARTNPWCVLAECLMSSYFNIVRKNFIDHVPKTIMCFLVNKAKGACRSQVLHV